MVDPTPDLEPGVTMSQVDDMIRDQLEAVKPIRPIDIGNVEREIQSCYYTTTQQEILEELR
eukprot:8555926-Pyramimonas_sp.AAC.1